MTKKIAKRLLFEVWQRAERMVLEHGATMLLSRR